VKRAIVIALSVILALVVAAPIASGKQPSTSETNLATLTAAWWNWALAEPAETSPLIGDYAESDPSGGDIKCDGSNTSGAWFLAAEFESEVNSTGDVFLEATRNCTVPAKTPLFFPVFNIVCGEPFGDDPANPNNPWTGDFTDCAGYFTDQALVNSTPEATVDGDDVRIQRVASGSFPLTLPPENVIGYAPGTYDVATDGLWVYLKKGRPSGDHVVKFGGEFTNPFPGAEPGSTITVNITYNLTME
jgi:hypothetical protein